LLISEIIDFDEALSIAQKTFGYTNHTLMAEALEQWPIKYYEELLPNVLEIIKKINDKLIKEIKSMGVKDEDVYKYEIIHNGNIKMAWLAIYGSKSVNGVAKLHTDLLIKKELNDWYKLYPEKFNNKTNGITQRRWLLQANPELSNLITRLLNTEEWIVDLNKLKGLEKFADDSEVLEE
ncbi:glycogen/starch/alpha-glucan phosphorylase, partial [Vibrio parahaemolyticus]|nr:glycogen/starch/alpha-glucan phosphorylase [Vibrio parahaemolyticus]